MQELYFNVVICFSELQLGCVNADRRKIRSDLTIRMYLFLGLDDYREFHFHRRISPYPILYVLTKSEGRVIFLKQRRIKNGSSLVATSLTEQPLVIEEPGPNDLLNGVGQPSSSIYEDIIWNTSNLQ